ncbi:MAG: PilZ domain-containing protein, partial [Hyphomicrobiales bacterium]|nr:PilZ domain-containing protein [Hyphomicrobiales bacterium]
MRAAAIQSAPLKAERRTFQRVRVKIYGRYMLEDRSEHPCQVIDMSPGNVSMRCDHIGEAGEKVIAYIDHIGRVEGVITRRLDDGFAMTVIASERKKDKLAAQLTWLANKHELDLPEDRRHERVAPRNPMSILQLLDGRQYQCR